MVNVSKRTLSSRALWGAALCCVACQSDPPLGPNDVSNAGGSEMAGISGAGGGAAGSAGTTPVMGGSASGGSASGGSVSGGSVSATSGASGTEQLPPIEECPGRPSVDRFTEWIASGEGTTVPAKGSILVQESGEYVAKVQLVGAGWHVIPVYIKNKFGDALDLSTSSGFTLTYSASAELHVQLRTKSHWSGGQQYATTIPATGGKKETRFFSFAEAGWKSLFGPPALSFADTLKEGMGLVFVGDGENEVVFYGLRIDGYTPACP